MDSGCGKECGIEEECCWVWKRVWKRRKVFLVLLPVVKKETLLKNNKHFFVPFNNLAH
jgi:hypothetical protein